MKDKRGRGREKGRKDGKGGGEQTGSMIVFNWVSTQQDLYFPRLVLRVLR